jgi:hypothetical protein
VLLFRLLVLSRGCVLSLAAHSSLLLLLRRMSLSKLKACFIAGTPGLAVAQGLTNERTLSSMLTIKSACSIEPAATSELLRSFLQTGL